MVIEGVVEGAALMVVPQEQVMLIPAPVCHIVLQVGQVTITQLKVPLDISRFL